MYNSVDFLRNLIKIKNKKKNQCIYNVDFIYLINLDIRTDRLNRCLQQLSIYNIQPHRVPGINGWNLTQDVFNDIAMKITSSMIYDQLVQYRFVAGGVQGEPFCPSDEGISCLHALAPAGGMGGCLTHLSIVYDGYLSNYDTIWVLEDDFTVNGNPHELSKYINELNRLVGENEWDVLFTDDDDYFTSDNLLANFGRSSWMKPGVPMNNSFVERTNVGDHFYKIGGRTQAHSYLVSRSGMKKIIDSVTSQGLFLPYDTELPCIPGIKLYNLKHDLVHGRDRKYSDTWVQRF